MERRPLPRSLLGRRRATSDQLCFPARFASYGWASHAVAYRSESSEGCLAVAHLGEGGLHPTNSTFPLASRATARQATPWPIVADPAKAASPEPFWAKADCIREPSLPRKPRWPLLHD